MSRLAIPIIGKTLWATGDVRLWADIALLIRDGSGQYQQERFRVDSGTEITTFPAYLAKQFGLAVPARPAPARHHPTGLEIRSGLLRFRIAGMDLTEYAVACLFLGDPSVVPSPAQAAAFPRQLLQPFALLDYLRFTIDHDPATSWQSPFVGTRQSVSYHLARPMGPLVKLVREGGFRRLAKVVNSYFDDPRLQ